MTGDYYVHFYLDELPDHSERANDFKDYLCGMQSIHDMERSGLHIRKIHPNFNPGISTGFRNYDYPHWESPYEHWCFVPNERV